MTEPKNRVPPPPPRREHGASGSSFDTAQLALSTTHSPTSQPLVGLKVVTIAPGSISYSDAEVSTSQVARLRQDPYLGSTIDGRYKVEALLGEGGMGVVYRCVHTIIGKRVAMKVLRSDLARDAEVVERFLNEAKAASSIGNAHIIDISDFGQFPDGAAYFVMEFLAGQPLSKLVEGGRPLSVSRILHLARQIAAGLSAAHAANIVHRDLKPDNIFLVERGTERDFVKILDFGIAKVSSSAEGARLTRAGAVFGTPHYMSPEQAAGQPVDHRVDIYSFGVILYEMATGRRPFEADSFYQLMSMHISDPPLPPTAHRNDLPRAIEDIILQALAKAPAERQASMAEVLSQLELARGNVAASAEALKRSRSTRTSSTGGGTTFGREEILAFLGDIDSKLDRPAGMEIIGGAAALLAWGAQSPTKDINTRSVDESILQIVPEANPKIPFNQVDVVVTTGYEDTRERLAVPFRHLVVWVPCRYHLLLMKAVRGSRRDLDVIVEMHRTNPFDLEVIVERSNDQTPRTFGSLETLEHLCLFIEKLFGPNRVHRLAALSMRQDFSRSGGQARMGRFPERGP